MEKYNGEQKQTFHQGALLNLLEKDYGTSDDEKACVRLIHDGICYMLSMEWLLELMTGTDKKAKSVFNNQYSDVANRAYYKQIANNYCKYSMDFEKTFAKQQANGAFENRTQLFEISEPIPIYEEGVKAIKDVDKYFVELCSQNKCTVKKIAGPVGDKFKTADFLTKFDPGKKEEQAFLIYLNVQARNPKELSFAHEMAIWYRKKDLQSYYFFDPNFGVYKYRTLDTILKEIMDNYVMGNNGYIMITEIENR